MKKLFVLFSLVLCIWLFTGCGANGEGNTEPSETPVNNENVAIDAFVCNDVDLKIGAEMTEDIKSALGTATDVQEAPSCHYDGNDTIYFYDGFTVYTYTENDKQIIYLIEITNENYVATKNTCVGMSFEDVKTTLGEPQEETELVLVYNLSETTAIRFTQENSVVSMIEYEEIK